MKTKIILAIALLLATFVHADPMRNPTLRDCDPDKDKECACSSGQTVITNGCVQITLDLGKTSPLSDSKSVSLKVLQVATSSSIFTPECLNVVLGYTFKYLGSDRTNKNVAKEVVFADSNGEAITFRFADGSSLEAVTAQSSMNQLERLQMVDAEGWTTLEDPAYYDLYPRDGTIWRYYATNITSELGELVSYTDEHARVTILSDFGVEIVRTSGGLLRQVLTPSRLADINTISATSYEVVPIPSPSKLLLPERDECSQNPINWSAVGTTTFFGAATAICMFCPFDGPLGEAACTGLTVTAASQIIIQQDKE